ncbi:hypothetical protein, partial [Bradyrhizobium sp.]|uniref:hypothetical protein n=1 Tax=Bradyrhizobium sp. TaxID=376 RepID=UPI003C147B12
PHLSSCGDFFRGPKLLIFSREIKFFKASTANSFDETRPIGRSAADFEHLFSNGLQTVAFEKLSRNSGGGEGAMTSKGAA